MQGARLRSFGAATGTNMHTGGPHAGRPIYPAAPQAGIGGSPAAGGTVGGPTSGPFKGIGNGHLLLGAAIVGSAVIYSFETSYSFFKGILGGVLGQGPALDKAEKASGHGHGGLHMPHLFAKDPHSIGRFKAIDETGRLVTEREVLRPDTFILMAVVSGTRDDGAVKHLADVTASVGKGSQLAGRLLRPLLLFPSLPEGEEGLRTLAQAMQQFQEMLSKAHSQLHDCVTACSVKAVTGHDVPEVADRAQNFLKSVKGQAAASQAESEPVLYVVDPEGHFLMAFQTEEAAGHRQEEFSRVLLAEIVQHTVLDEDFGSV